MNERDWVLISYGVLIGMSIGLIITAATLGVPTAITMAVLIIGGSVWRILVVGQKR